MERGDVFPNLLILVFAAVAGIAGASLIYALLFKVLLTREAVLNPRTPR